MLKVTALFVVLMAVFATKETGPAKVISAGFVVPVVIVPANEVKPVWVGLPIINPANLPPAPKIASVPSNIAAVMLRVLPVLPMPIVPELV